MENESITANAEHVAASGLLSAIVAELRRLQNAEPPRVPRRAYSVAEVAEMLSVTEKTVRGCIDRGELQTVEVGRHLRITESSFQRFLQS
jgi:excisionase family DNA binding protein